jgi:hypothetical protein
MDFNGNKDLLSDREREVLSIYKKFNKSNKHKMKKIPIFKNEKL